MKTFFIALILVGSISLTAEEMSMTTVGPDQIIVDRSIPPNPSMSTSFNGIYIKDKLNPGMVCDCWENPDKGTFLIESPLGPDWFFSFGTCDTGIMGIGITYPMTSCDPTDLPQISEYIPEIVPTLSEWAVILLLILMLIFGSVAIQNALIKSEVIRIQQ